MKASGGQQERLFGKYPTPVAQTTRLSWPSCSPRYSTRELLRLLMVRWKLELVLHHEYAISVGSPDSG